MISPSHRLFVAQRLFGRSDQPIGVKLLADDKLTRPPLFLNGLLSEGPGLRRRRGNIAGAQLLRCTCWKGVELRLFNLVSEAQLLPVAPAGRAR